MLRAPDAVSVRPGEVLQLDLAPAGLARLDPRRIDAAVEEGRAAGFEAGYADGRAAALAEARAQQAAALGELRGRFGAVLAAAEAALAAAVDEVAATAAEAATATAATAFELASAVVGRELALATDPGLDAVRRALAVAPEGVEVTVRLHPDDAAALDVASLPPTRSVTVVPDPTLSSGDCVADAGWIHIDARIGAALDRVRAVLESAS